MRVSGGGQVLWSGEGCVLSKRMSCLMWVIEWGMCLAVCACGCAGCGRC